MTRAVIRAVAATIVLASCTSTGAGGGRPTSASAPRPAWRWSAPAPASVGMPAADGDAVAVTWGHEYLTLLDGSGTPRWETRRLGLRDVAPLLTDDAVYAATDEGVAAFDRRTGQLRWDTVLGERASTPARPTTAGGAVVVSTWEGSLVSLETSHGRVAWRVTLPGPSLGPPVADPDVVVATWESDDGETGGAVAVDGASGALRWQGALPGGGVSGPTLMAGDGPAGATVAVVAGDVAAHGLAVATGKERWRVELGGSGSPEVPPLAMPDGGVLVADRLAGLTLLDQRGAKRWSARVDGAAVRGGPVGPGPQGRFALPLDGGGLWLAGPRGASQVLELPGRVSGVAVGPGGVLLVATREADQNALVAETSW